MVSITLYHYNILAWSAIQIDNKFVNLKHQIKTIYLQKYVCPNKQNSLDALNCSDKNLSTIKHLI